MLKIYFFLFILLCCTGNVLAESVDADAMLIAHNDWRARDGVPAIAWSQALQFKAEQWANYLKNNNGCRMKHSGSGENLFWASASRRATTKDVNGNWIWQNYLQNIQTADVVKSWGSEKQWYDYANNRCNAPAGESCGHYTQIVWKNSTEVGCGKAVCSDMSQIWVCNYAPAGNRAGQKPY